MLSSDDLTSGITRRLVFIPVTLLGNDLDPIAHLYFTSESAATAAHVSVADCERSTASGEGFVVKYGAVSKEKIYDKTAIVVIL